MISNYKSQSPLANNFRKIKKFKKNKIKNTKYNKRGKATHRKKCNSAPIHKK